MIGRNLDLACLALIIVLIGGGLLDGFFVCLGFFNYVQLLDYVCSKLIILQGKKKFIERNFLFHQCPEETFAWYQHLRCLFGNNLI